MKRCLAWRRAGWKIKAHGESVAGKGNRDGIRQCMKVHLFTLDHFTEGNGMPYCAFDMTAPLGSAWEEIFS